MQSMNNSRLYFPQNIFPNKSNPCCVSNTTYLLNKLRSAVNSTIIKNITRPRCLLLDSIGLVVTVEEGSSGSSPSFDRLDPVTLELQTTDNTL